MRTACTKPEQVKAWINNNHQQWEFWKTVVAMGTYAPLNKTKEQAEALANYYEGRYDMACNFREILENEY